MYKKDKKLGEKIHLHLKKFGVETPFFERNLGDDKKRLIEDRFTDIMRVLGLDLNDDSLAGTPARVAKLFVDEIFYGLDYANFPKCTTVSNKMGYDEMVTVSDIDVSSTCEHHFVVIDGLAKVSYIPKEKVLGLSKINRVVEFFSKRPQIQERLTEQIYFALSKILDTEDVAVQIKAVHHCVKSRGVKDTGSKTTTTKLGGAFKEIEVRQEFFNVL